MVHCLTWIQEFWSMFAMERDNSEGWSEEDTKNEKKNPHSDDIADTIDLGKFESELVEEIDFRKCKSDENKNLLCNDSLEYIDLSKYKTFSECRPWESTYKSRNAGNESRIESSFRSRNGGNDGFENLDSRELANRINYGPRKDLRQFKSGENKNLPCDDNLEKIDCRKYQPNDEQHSTFGEWPSCGSTCNGKNARNKSTLEPSCRSRNEGGSDGFNNLDSRELPNRINYFPQKDLKGFKRDEDEILPCDDIPEKIDLTKYNPNVEQHSTLDEWRSWESACKGRNAHKSRVEPSFRSRTEGGRDRFEILDSRELAKRINSAPRKDVLDRFNYGTNAGSEPRVEGPLRCRNERGSDGYENFDSRELANRFKYAPVKDVFDRSSYAYDVEVSDTKKFINKTTNIPSQLDVNRGLDSAYTARKRRESLSRFEKSFSTRSRRNRSPWGWSMTPWGLNSNGRFAF